MISRDQVSHIANLARIRLTDEELTTFQSNLTDVLEYVEQMNEVATDQIEPTAQVTGLVNVAREDVLENEQTLSQDQALLNAPEKKEGYFKVKAVL